ncbi:hypothetical protein PAXRUDRAFT_342706 [Paxillus rubicundulus Ve08.2h10]|uniref:Uncharacterized protein n=1 Tax=Paxillus rubicundulus Ve08.2h10 TaxID=930991 RepID=A0A0D0DEN4_9AGAM|nr:hypothetical protein PAXRUDRAFT_342706 [Paxillus rubicundulus Ve08.2h10]
MIFTLETAVGPRVVPTGWSSVTDTSVTFCPTMKQSHQLEPLGGRAAQLLRPVHHQDRDRDRGALADPFSRQYVGDPWQVDERYNILDSLLCDVVLVREGRTGKGSLTTASR